MLLRSALCGCLLLASPSAALFSKSPSTTSSRSGISDALLYDSYNQLHQLSQSLPGLLDSPTIVIVGRQTDGKSALLESLMGFHFNDVGGGTKTRRPIALQMQYHAEREEPVVYLATPNGERPLSLDELQDYVTRENHRLERLDGFAAEEIVVRIEYKYCPNLSIVDTPGLLLAPSEPALEGEGGAGAVGGGAGGSGGGSGGESGVEDGTAAAAAAAAFKRAKLQASGVESLIKGKLSSPEVIILCVEDTNTWEGFAPARSVVSACDPTLCRTVLVSTKLDTKFAQFGSPQELSAFLSATPLRERHPHLLGGPFFTSVPCGRVGGGAGAQHFATHEAFQAALLGQESTDAQYVDAVLPGWGARMAERYGREASAADSVTAGSLPPSSPSSLRGANGGLGVSSLRQFLEALLRERYLQNLRTVVPQLQQASAKLEADLRRTERALNELGSLQVHAALREAVNKFVRTLQGAIRGTANAAAGKLGETLAEEHAAAGAISHPAMRRAAEAAAAAGGGGGVRGGVNSADRATVEGAPSALRIGGSGGAGLRIDRPLGVASTHPGLAGPAAAAAAAADADARGEGTDGPPPEAPPGAPPGAPPVSHEDASAALFGGAQFYRLMAEFRHAVLTLPDELPTAEELMNSMGLGAADARSGHTGRAASAIALSRHVAALEPLLEQLHARLRHVLLRCLEYVRASAFSPEGGALADDFDDASTYAGTCAALERVAGDKLWSSLSEAFTAHLNACVRKCAEACQDDLGEIDRLTLGGSGAAMGPPTTSRSVVDRAARAAERVRDDEQDDGPTGGGWLGDGNKRRRQQQQQQQLSPRGASSSASALAGALRGLAGGRGRGSSTDPSEAMVGEAMVRYVCGEWKRRVSQSVTRKAHAYMMLQFVDSLPHALSSHLEACFEGPGGLDLSEARSRLEERRAQLAREHARVSRMVHTFQSVSRVYSRAAGGGGGGGGGGHASEPAATYHQEGSWREGAEAEPQMATQPTQPPQLSPTQGLSFMRGNGAGA